MSLVLALNLFQFAVQAAATYLSFLIATNGKTRAGYLMALGMLAFAVHNVLEMMTEDENFYVTMAKLAASIFLLAAVWLLYKEIMSIIKEKEE